MTNAERLESFPPRPALTRRQRAEQVFGRILLATALILASLALGKALQALSCLNSSLGERGPQGQAYDNAVSDAFEVIYLSGKGQITKPAAQARFLHDAAVVNHVAAYRKAHPLGKC